jgi:hypothetical protein
MTVMMPAMMLIMNGIMLLIIWVGAHQIEEGTIQVGDMMAYIQYAMPPFPFSPWGFSALIARDLIFLNNGKLPRPPEIGLLYICFILSDCLFNF